MRSGARLVMVALDRTNTVSVTESRPSRSTLSATLTLCGNSGGLLGSPPGCAGFGLRMLGPPEGLAGKENSIVGPPGGGTGMDG
jgi:hypothetical protein